MIETYLKTKNKKSHTCEGGAHLRISAWHLLMNLKNNYLLIKKLLTWTNKKSKNSNIYNILKKKNTWKYHYFKPAYQKSWYDLQLQFLRCRVWKTDIGTYGSFFPFLSPPPPSHPSLQKKFGGGGGCIFCPVTSLTIWKIILKKWKKHLEISLFNTCEPKITIIWCMLPEVWSATDNFSSFWAIFCPFTQLLTPKIKIWKKCTKTQGILSFNTCVP